MKRALITGITGQDGSFLMEHLLQMEYEVWGVIRRNSNSATINMIRRLSKNRVNLRYGDLTDPASIARIITECRPHEVYNLAAQSHVRVSFDIPEYTSEVNATGVVNVLEALRSAYPEARFYQASTSEMFGITPPPQNEESLLHPRSPYGVAKVHGYWAVRNYRESYKMFASNGILFNHESERRGENFVTRKITKAVARIKLGNMDEEFLLGNLDAKRDWGYAKDYVKVMHLMLQHDEPDDFVVATGEAHTVRDFLEAAFGAVDIPVMSDGDTGVDEKYVRQDTGEVVLKLDKRFYRPAEVDYLCGDATKAKKLLGWKPETSFDELVMLMVRYDLEAEAK